MRAAFLALLVINLGYLAWSQWLAAPVGSTTSPPPADVPRLLLSSEPGAVAAAANAAAALEHDPDHAVVVEKHPVVADPQAVAVFVVDQRLDVAGLGEVDQLGADGIANLLAGASIDLSQLAQGPIARRPFEAGESRAGPLHRTWRQLRP